MVPEGPFMIHRAYNNNTVPYFTSKPSQTCLKFEESMVYKGVIWAQNTPSPLTAIAGWIYHIFLDVN